MIIKVCGMRDPENMAALEGLNQVDWMGMIFHPASPRAVNRSAEILERSFQNESDSAIMRAPDQSASGTSRIPDNPAPAPADAPDQSAIHATDDSAIPISKPLQRVGVFVNQPLEAVRATAREFKLDRLQLHGDETPAYCEELAREWPIIKVFRISSTFDPEILKPFEPHCTHFLFDTAGPQHGGNGIAFDWTLLDRYTGKTPFLLAGGIGPVDAERIASLHHPSLAGLDLNSGFEIKPGLKNIPLLSQFLHQLS